MYVNNKPHVEFSAIAFATYDRFYRVFGVISFDRRHFLLIFSPRYDLYVPLISAFARYAHIRLPE